MKEIIIIFVLAIVYLSSAIYLYKWFKKAYSPEGRWSNLHLYKSDIFCFLMPVINTLIVVFNFFDSPYRKKI